MLEYQAVDRNNGLQRATMLVDTLSRHCDDVTFLAFRESLIAVGQQRIVDQFFTRTETVIRQTSGT